MELIGLKEASARTHMPIRWAHSDAHKRFRTTTAAKVLPLRSGMEDHWQSLDEVCPKQKEGRHRPHGKHHQWRGNRRNESWTMDPRGDAICHSYPSNLVSSFPWLRQVLWIKTGPLVVRFVSFTLLCHSDCINRSRHWGCEWNPGFCDLNYFLKGNQRRAIYPAALCGDFTWCYRLFIYRHIDI